MSFITDPEKRKIYARKIKSFWLDFSHNKVGFIGLGLLILFVVVAALAPVLAPENPIHQHRVAGKYAMPSWMQFFTSKELPPTQYFPFNLTVAPENQSCTTINVHYPEDGICELRYRNDGRLTNQTYIFESRFNYSYRAPPDWRFQTDFKTDFDGLGYRFEVRFKSPNGSEWIVWGTDYDVVEKRVRPLDKHYNRSEGSILTGSGSTDLKRRIYYEKFYAIFLPIYLEKYPFVNITFEPKFFRFTYEGFRNITSQNQTDNPIYQTFQKNETSTNWTQYWHEWINTTEAQELWNATHQYLTSSWSEFSDKTYIQNITQVLENSTLLNKYLEKNVLFQNWYKGERIPGTDIQFKDAMSWDEFYTIFNLSLTTLRDEEDLYYDAMNSTESLAYERWNSTDTDLSWNLYLTAWTHIQWWHGRNDFLNNYLKGLRLGPEMAITRAKAEAYREAASSRRPTYYLAHQGTQAVRLYLFIEPESENATLNMTFREPSEFIVWGAIYGLLGTNSFGFDVWTQLVHGARISLIVGALAAVLSTTLGILFGVTAGYLGGIADEVTMRIVDILLCLPVLPLLLAMAAIWKPNVYYLVLIIAIFGWQGLSRTIRSKTLQLREMPFIESARASGASNSYLIIRHLIPNVFPIAMASMVLAVPGAILTEAALSYLGFGDPFAPTWGKMLHEANSEGAFGRLAWWYILPPGFAITILCLGFVFISHALDEIVNPRLRRRR